jgi:type I restriction enzyme S subunit
MRDIPIILPHLEIQKYLVNKIVYSFDYLEDSRKKISKAKSYVQRFRQSVLSAAVTGKLTEEWREKNYINFDWTEVKLKDICPTITDGDHQPPPKTKSGIPFLVINNINTGKLNFENTRYVSEDYYNNIPEYKVPKQNDVLYSVVGSIGIPVLVKTNERFCFQRHIALLRSNGLINPEYLYFLLLSDLVHKQAISVATGSAQMTVPLNGLRSIEIRLPLKEEQQEIVRRVKSMFEIADFVEKQIEIAGNKAEKLTQSILAKAFRGEL